MVALFNLYSHLFLSPSNCPNKFNRVPKELISRFVKICPTCQVRRGGSHLSPPDSRRNSPTMELSRPQRPQSTLAYMRAQPASSEAYDDYRRKSSSSSSYGYSDRSRGSTAAWGYASPAPRHSEMAWSQSHHGGRQHAPSHTQSYIDDGNVSGGSHNGRMPSNMKYMNMHVDGASSPPSSSSSSGQMVETSPSQAQYVPGYITTHSNNRYRSGY